VIAVLDVEERAFGGQAAKRGIFAYVAGPSDATELQSAIDFVLRRLTLMALLMTGRPIETSSLVEQGHTRALSSSRSLVANASGSPAHPYSPPRKPPWWLGKTTGVVPSRSATA
jgi:hypothetical protein